MQEPFTRFLDLEDLDDERIARLLQLARELEADPVRTTLAGKVLALVFLAPSLRTLTSFQAGMAQLGGTSVVLTPGQGTWQLETRPGVVMDGAAAEHAAEAVPVLEQYADALAVRSFGSGDPREDVAEPVLTTFAKYARGPLISLESATNHPCQALADWKTLDDLAVASRGGRFTLAWAWHPKALPVAVPAAAAAMAARRGMDVTILRPEGFALPEPLQAKIERAAERGGGSVRETSDRNEGTAGAHVIYAKSWGAPEARGDAEREAALRAPHRDWCVRESTFAGAASDAHFMHCLPVRRNVVVADEVLDGPRSQVIRQAGNRLHVQKAVTLEMLS